MMPHGGSNSKNNVGFKKNGNNVGGNNGNNTGNNAGNSTK